MDGGFSRRWRPNNTGKKYKPRVNHLTQNHGRYLVRVPVPKAVKEFYRHATVERYLGTKDRREAEMRSGKAVEEIRREFDAFSRKEAINADAIKRMVAVEKWRAYESMLADPNRAPAMLDDWLAANLADYETAARDALRRAGFAPNDHNLKAAQRALDDAYGDARKLWDQGQAPPKPSAYVAPRISTGDAEGLTIDEAADEYCGERGAKVSAKTKAQIRQTARLFADHAGHDAPVSAVTGRDAVAFLDRLERINPDYRRAIGQSGTISLQDIEAKHDAGEGRGLVGLSSQSIATNGWPCAIAPTGSPRQSITSGLMVRR